jgi:hypothetical protein
MPAFVNASNVRSFAGIEGITGQWTESNLGSNIRAASSLLQRVTGRQFEAQTAVTKKFTTQGDSFVAIPDLRTASSVVLHDSTQTADTDYFLVPDTLQTGVYLGIQFPRYEGRADYRSFSDWFDRNLDRHYPYRIPDNLEITGDWGHDPLPDDLLYVTKALAAFLTKNPDALLSGFTATPDGTLVEAGDLPKVVASFISQWKVGSQVASL